MQSHPLQLSLSEIIKERICNKGPVSFHDFMEMALYYPGLGYYTSAANKIGENGDYYTSPYLSNVFGQVIAKQLEEMWQLTGKKDFTIVEYGAGPGSLCVDILTSLKNNKKFYKNLKYCIIEKSEAMRLIEQKVIDKERLAEKISWHNSIEETSAFTGCILANEVIDNFSVHKVVMKEKELMEVFVDYNNDFKELLRPASDDIKNYFKNLNVELPEHYCTEVNLQAVDWIKNVSASLNKGFVLTIDYGFPSSELYHPYRKQGTIVCYHKQSVNDLPYINIGQQDITAHVNFSALNLWGVKSGLTNCGFTDQSRFLLGLGLTQYLRKLEETEKGSFEIRKKIMLLHTLLMSMGKKFKVLIQQKGLQKPVLSGLKFCQPLL
ncbi:MAG TPA: SAM-dependent methyltransferase [Chitinophagaceae bacterium]|nr:SAM-dependent methyltransferase [Chitinophagaceae bacterium]